MSNKEKLPTISAEELHEITRKKREEMNNKQLVVEKWLKENLSSILYAMKRAAERYETQFKETIPDDFSNVTYEGMPFNEYLEQNVFIRCRVQFTEEEGYCEWEREYFILIQWDNHWIESEDDDDDADE
jgi:hypothetical protein